MRLFEWRVRDGKEGVDGCFERIGGHGRSERAISAGFVEVGQNSVGSGWCAHLLSLSLGSLTKLVPDFIHKTEALRGDAYQYFIASLKASPTFAPAFTSLGIYFSSHASPPDPIRASKCFQKAVELDSREGEAARRLAEGFADEREWDLVEVVAKRAIEGEGGAEGNIMGNEMAARRYMAVNAWAWKAIGVVELVSHAN